MRVTIIKDYKENPKKCSILWLRGKKNFEFLDRLKFDEYDFSGMLLLHPEGEPVSKIKRNEKILLVDSNWRKARRMYNRLQQKFKVKLVSIPGFKSVYPWKKGRPDNGLCSIEVLWALSLLAGKRDDSLFQNYQWKREFLEVNENIIKLNKLQQSQKS